MAGEVDYGAVLAVLCVLLVALWAAPHLHTYWERRHFMIGRTRRVRSRLDGRHYRVHLSHSDPVGAADQLALLHQQTVKLMAALRRKYAPPDDGFAPNDPAPPSERREIVRRLLDRYDRDLIAESSPNNPEGDTSYTINKGMLLALCLREKDPARSGRRDVHDLHDSTTLWFVTVHELAHLGINEYNHPPEFWSCFKFLLQECVQAGVAPAGGWPDYGRNPIHYCGLSVDYNPYYDPVLPTPA